MIELLLIPLKLYHSTGLDAKVSLHQEWVYSFCPKVFLLESNKEGKLAGTKCLPPNPRHSTHKQPLSPLTLKWTLSHSLAHLLSHPHKYYLTYPVSYIQSHKCSASFSFSLMHTHRHNCISHTFINPGPHTPHYLPTLSPHLLSKAVRVQKICPKPSPC